MADNSVSKSKAKRAPAPASRSPSKLPDLYRYIISATILGAGIGLCYWLSTLKEKPKEQSTSQLIPLVATDSVQPYSGQIDMEVSGSVVPYREIRVAAKVMGNIVKKYDACEAGNFVTAGTKLLEIDPSDYANQLATSKAELEQAKKSLAENAQEIAAAEDALRLAKRDLSIAKAEFQRSQRIKSALSKAEFDQAKRALLNSETQVNNRENNLKLAKSRTQRLNATVRLSETRVQGAETNLARATVTAPDDGIIVDESVQEGDFVSMGSPLLTFEDTRKSEVICNLSPRDLDWIRTNSTLTQQLKDEIEQNQSLAAYYLPKTDVAVYESDNERVVWKGKLERFDGIGRDNATRTIPTRIVVEDPVVKSGDTIHALVRGMFVKCKIQVQVSAGDSEKRFLAFPAVALRPGGFVWTIADNKLKRIDVQVVDRTEIGAGDDAEKIIVIRHLDDSLQPDDSIVVSPIPQAVDGMEVQTEDLPGYKKASLEKEDDPAA
jgi:multidrug efflux pump subunit AcrA (membrane-fusion protein)